MIRRLTPLLVCLLMIGALAVFAQSGPGAGADLLGDPAIGAVSVGADPLSELSVPVSTSAGAATTAAPASSIPASSIPASTVPASSAPASTVAAPRVPAGGSIPAVPELTPTAAVATADTTSSSEPSSDPSSEPSAESAADASACAAEGRSAVVDRQHQRAWLCDNGVVAHEMPITTALSQPDPGTFDVYAKQLESSSTLSGEYSTMTHFVAFTYGKYQGARIAFHSVPKYANGEFVQPLESVGSAERYGESAGCIRVLPDDAELIWSWLDVGATVTVIS